MYGLGGNLAVHQDAHGCLKKYEIQAKRAANANEVLGKDVVQCLSDGETVATILGWLKDVSAGGGTAFSHPEARDVLFPERGSIAFWYNTLSSSDQDDQTSHSGCPVIAGSKMILDKWVRSFDNWKNVPCSIHGAKEYISLFPKPNSFV